MFTVPGPAGVVANDFAEVWNPLMSWVLTDPSCSWLPMRYLGVTPEKLRLSPGIGVVVPDGPVKSVVWADALQPTFPGRVSVMVTPLVVEAAELASNVPGSVPAGGLVPNGGDPLRRVPVASRVNLPRLNGWLAVYGVLITSAPTGTVTTIVCGSVQVVQFPTAPCRLTCRGADTPAVNRLDGVGVKAPVKLKLYGPGPGWGRPCGRVSTTRPLGSSTTGAPTV